MTLDHLINHVRARRVCGNTTGVAVNDIASDSRDVAPGVLFVATRGSAKDGHAYIEAALAKGAAAIVLDDEACVAKGGGDVPFIVVDDAKAALLEIARCFFGDPQKRVRLIGITGTNGKTTTSYLVRSVIQASGQKCGVIGTIGYLIDDENIPFANTTPGVIMLYRILRKMDDAGVRWAAIEVSSHALDQGRVAGISFHAVLFTNLTQDHLDYHETMEAYFDAKKKLFEEHVEKTGIAVINADDAYGQKLMRLQRAGTLIAYGFGPAADVLGEDDQLKIDSSSIMIKTPKGTLRVSTPLVGRHNLYNILGAVAFAVGLGLDLPVIKEGVEALARVPGRLERVDSPKGFSVFIDYAHTDDALKNVLESLRQIPHNGRIITVFGCGGGRDRGKRPKMGRVVTDLSDYAIITSDNPRDEDPRSIAGDIVAGVISKNFEIELDRHAAIQKALAAAGAGDFVLVAGKGHESTQTVKGCSTPFDDKEVVLELLKHVQS